MERRYPNMMRKKDVQCVLHGFNNSVCGISKRKQNNYRRKQRFFTTKLQENVY